MFQNSCFCGNCDTFSLNILWLIESSKGHIFCNIIKVFTLTFDQFNAARKYSFLPKYTSWTLAASLCSGMSDVGKAWRGSLGMAASRSKTLGARSIVPSRAKGGFWLVRGMLGNGEQLMAAGQGMRIRQRETGRGSWWGEQWELGEMQLEDDLNGCSGSRRREPARSVPECLW